ncbi:hypothetical protein Cgig2_031928 [Carnegiea gigantea]|uniref:Uncharacterized protein n=1 Tax=Carnegiea gigantea TaxID=171969 RepID=A0A9Q1GSW7_9CARY|nr:hypothetical protein Cgig2_031928 [Carnegiea gigantea]
MLLNEVERLGVLQGQALRSLESALTELRWGAFESWIWLFGDRIYEARFRPKVDLGENAGVGRQEESSGRGMTGGLAIGFLGVSLVFSSPNSSSINTTSLSHIGCSSVHHSGGVGDNIGRVVSVPVPLVSMAFPPIHSIKEMANYVRETFIWRWRSASRPPRPLPEDSHVLCPRFSLVEAENAATEFELPEMVQVTFYAMLLNEAVELGMTHEYTAESMKSSLAGLRWSTFEVWMDCMNCILRGAQLYRPADEVEVRGF